MLSNLGGLMSGREWTSLRERLRYDTHVMHNQVDAMVSEFDLTTVDGLSCLLRMQSAALGLIIPHTTEAQSSYAIRDLHERAVSDLRQLKEEVVLPYDQSVEALHPYAIDYVIAGSRLGSQILKKRWLSATDDRVRQADAYFSAPSYIEVWKSFCVSAEEMQPDGEVADQIVRDADRIFQLYQASARAAPLSQRVIHV